VVVVFAIVLVAAMFPGGLAVVIMLGTGIDFSNMFAIVVVVAYTDPFGDTIFQPGGDTIFQPAGAFSWFTGICRFGRFAGGRTRVGRIGCPGFRIVANGFREASAP
jgi:hypothetical protein